MRPQYLRLLILELFLITFSFLQFIILKQFNIYLYVFEVLCIYVVLRLLYKDDKKNKFQKNNVMLIVLISCLVYYAIIYISGFFVGFVYSTYSRSIMGILRNVFFSSVFIVILEYIREIIIQKSKYYKSLIILSIVVLTLLELLFTISLIQMSDKRTVLEILMIVVIPCLFRNIFLTYSTYNFNVYCSIVYHLLIMEINYIVPVFPNIGNYLYTVLLILHPIITIVLCSNFAFYKKKKIEDTVKFNKKIKIQKYAFYVISVFLLITIYLISDIGRFTMMAIGSESMTGTINKGDVVLIDKKKREYKIGDIMAYDYDGSIIVHRVVEIKDNKISKAYITKGDKNESNDTWVSYNEHIRGKIVLRLRFIGWPTVKLSEYISEINN